jgi:hypothetical protein
LAFVYDAGMYTLSHTNRSASIDDAGRLRISRPPAPASFDRHGRLTLSPQMSWLTIAQVPLSHSL